MKYSSVSSFAALALAAGLAAASPLRSGKAPIYTPPNVFSGEGDIGAAGADGHLIPDSYIVVLKESHAHHLDWHLDHLGANVLNKAGELIDYVEEVAHHFTIGDFRGYAGRFSEASLDWIRSHPAVEYVERDSVVKAMDIENGAPWGLARISHRKALSLGTLSKYEYAHNGGEGVDVYVIDTGINIEHVEFEGRAKWGKTMPQNDVDADGNGHGTHCAGTIASARYGVAKDAHLIAVKVLGSSGSGSMSDVVGGVAWAASAATAKMQTEAARNGTHKGSVANMSLGGGKSPSLDLAVNRAVKAGLHFAVAAGNDNRDACSYSPAAAENAITVGASTIGDQRAYFSNFGKCVDIFAPGLNILSTWNTGPRSTNRISGTSMASPHIAGLTAYYLSLYGSGDFAPSQADYEAAGVAMPGSAEEESSLFSKGRQLVFNGIFGGAKKEGSSKPLDPKVLKAAMLRLSTRDVLTGIPSDGTPNKLAFNNFTTSGKSLDLAKIDFTKLPEVDAEIVEEDVEEDLENTLVHYQPIFDKGEAMVEDAKVTLERIEELIEEVIQEDLAYLAKAAEF